jgi:hypothetical protein
MRGEERGDARINALLDARRSPTCPNNREPTDYN